MWNGTIPAANSSASKQNYTVGSDGFMTNKLPRIDLTQLQD